MPPREFYSTPKGTFVVAIVLCLACSAVVSIAAVGLSGLQEANKALDKKKNVLRAAGKNLLVDEGIVASEASVDEVAAAFNSLPADKVNSIFEERFVQRFMDIDTGEVIDPNSDDLPEGFDPATYDAKKAAADPKQQEPIEGGALPGIANREPYAEFYEIVKDGEVNGYVFPIYGKGLWSTLYGFLAVEADGETVRGITYYEHKETPGLGGEVDNVGWKSLWPGKKLYEQPGQVALSVIKGTASKDDPYAIDGLSGATITANGVDGMIKYWLGPQAFGQYLSKQGDDA